MPTRDPYSRNGWTRPVLLACFFLCSRASAAQDALPYGAISFFDLQSCPAGWQSLDMAAGRLMVAVPANFGLSGTVGEPLSSQQDPTHTHSISSSIDVDDVEYILVGGCCNKSLGSDGQKNFTGTSAAASSALPYVQYLVCLKTSSPPSNVEAIAPGTLMFFGVTPCPAGWNEAITTEGRFLVGLPTGASPGVTFGGSALGDLEDRTHAHGFSGSVSTTSQSIVGGSGCCADGYAKDGTYTYTGTSGAAGSGLPYIQFLSCKKS